MRSLYQDQRGYLDVETCEISARLLKVAVVGGAMSVIPAIPKAETPLVSFPFEEAGGSRQAGKPLVSLVVPAYNEAALVERNLHRLCRYMKSLENEYRWEIIFINDGSTDQTGELAEAFANTRDNMHVFHHMTNFGVGQAFKLAFEHCRGDYVVTLDLDLSYSPDHIRKLLTKIRETRAKIVVASPYMKEGMVSNVPRLRRILSTCANRFLARTARGSLSTLTSMVRAYDGKFVKSLNLRSLGMEVNPEVIYKAKLLNARIDEIPAHLDWGIQKAEGVKRRSSMKVLRHTLAILVSGFLFRPVMFFIIPGLGLLLFAFYVNTWTVIHFFEEYQNLAQYTWFFSRASAAVGAAYSQYPHTFIVGLLSLMLAIQLLSLGILALQSKSYFEEIFHLGASIHKLAQENSETDDK
jgi:glycosyltransferase involved in cell wall biosynthesis